MNARTGHTINLNLSTESIHRDKSPSQSRADLPKNPKPAGYLLVRLVKRVDQEKAWNDSNL